MRTIPDSDLILNKENHIYHLDLHPDELADTVITVGDPNRVSTISKHFDSIEVTRQHREMVTHTGYVGKKRISVLSTGMGTDNIDIVLNELDALKNIDFSTRQIKKELKQLTIIRIGTSGALQADVPLDSFVATSIALGLDSLLHYYQQKNNEEEKALLNAFISYYSQDYNLATQPYLASGSMDLLELFSTDCRTGITATCAGFYAPQGRHLRLPTKRKALVDILQKFNYQDQRILNFEMETAGIYGLSQLMNHRCLSLSAIVANRVTEQFSKQAQNTVERLISLVFDKIEML